MLHKTPLGIVIDKILSKCSLKSTDQKNMPKTPPKFLLQKAVLNFSSKNTMRRCHPTHCQKFVPMKRLY